MPKKMIYSYSLFCRVFLYDEFLSEQECDGLMRAHDSHVKESSKINPLICFDTIETLRKHIKTARKKVKVTPADFIPGQLKNWMSFDSDCCLLSIIPLRPILLSDTRLLNANLMFYFMHKFMYIPSSVTIKCLRQFF